MSRLKFVDVLFGLLFGVFACWFLNGFFHGDASLHNFELVPNYFTRLIQLGLYLLAGLCVVAVVYIYSLCRAGKFRWRTILFPLTALLLGVLLVFPVGSHIYERTMMVKEPMHAFTQLFPNPIPDELLSDQNRQRKLIVCLGGSTTAWGDEQYRKWPQLLEGHLKDRGHDVAVLNQGRPWFTTMHSKYNYQSNISRLKPDIVIVMHAINDLQTNGDESYYSSGPFREDYGHYLGPSARVQRIQPLFDLVCEVARRSWYFPERTEIDSTEFGGLSVFKQNLVAITELAQRDGAEVVLMTQGTLYKDEMSDAEKQKLYLAKYNSVGETSKWSHERARAGMKLYNEATREVAGELAVNLIDLEKIVPQDLEHFKDDVHLSSPSMDVISETLAERIGSLLVPGS